MDDEQVNNTIAELERCLRTDDPSLARRLRRIRRGDSARSAAVFAALVTAAILLAAGLAIASGVVWFAGVAALLAAFAVAPHREPTAADSPTLQGRRVDQWNEVLPIAGAWSTVASELRAADGLDPWCHARHNRGRRWAPSPGHLADLTSVVRRWNPLASRCWRAKPRRASHSATHADRRARSDLGACRGAPMPKFTPSTTHDPPGNQNRAATVGRNAHRNPTMSQTGGCPGVTGRGPVWVGGSGGCGRGR